MQQVQRQSIQKQGCRKSWNRLPWGHYYSAAQEFFPVTEAGTSFASSWPEQADISFIVWLTIYHAAILLAAPAFSRPLPAPCGLWKGDRLELFTLRQVNQVFS